LDENKRLCSFCGKGKDKLEHFVRECEETKEWFNNLGESYDEILRRIWSEELDERKGEVLVRLWKRKEGRRKEESKRREREEGRRRNGGCE